MSTTKRHDWVGGIKRVGIAVVLLFVLGLLLAQCGPGLRVDGSRAAYSMLARVVFLGLVPLILWLAGIGVYRLVTAILPFKLAKVLVGGALLLGALGAGALAMFAVWGITAEQPAPTNESAHGHHHWHWD